MKHKWLIGKRGKSGLKSVVLWGAFVSAVLVGFGATVTAALAGIASKNDEMVLKLREMTAFDPFTLKTVVVTRRADSAEPTPPKRLRRLDLPSPAEAGYAKAGAAAKAGSEDDPPADMLRNTVPAEVMKRPPIRIPYRPAPRSPFRPPLVPAATSHWRE